MMHERATIGPDIMGEAGERAYGSGCRPAYRYSRKYTQHTRFRDHYFKRFPEIQRVRNNNATSEEVFCIRMVMERFGYDLIRFYNENEQLCESICKAVYDKEPYDTLAAGYYELLAAEEAGRAPAGSAQSVNVSVNHPLGIEAVGIYYWDQLNPLLGQAYQIMDQQTLNALFLAR
jgi:hypothetical protein